MYFNFSNSDHLSSNRFYFLFKNIFKNKIKKKTNKEKEIL